MRWSEVDLESRILDLPGARTKNKRPFVIPLSETAHDILASIPRRAGRDLIFGKGAGRFQGLTKSKSELDAKLAGMAPWTLHDLRRTASTRMHELGVEPHIVEACLNHVSGTGPVLPALTIGRPTSRRRRRLSICGRTTLLSS